ncbi:hypothetical protein GUITHDRAFT_162758 [Guillardia theta CCMP2712]|uniref:Uncharacterized protein n=3 Tax=Guillardia theta TaxID=55529 RepID=L1JFG4_GUITC|nr:hypothetical protein GUITHDRAFT_162758 [Guillardia theta CCMP2712]EKX47062.1 hypothetical protein GUITHDRAFT_162758 [Guillardia theta CCMP2712]|mmetsp:Transcript_26584/g.87302  ORF Transcript_26584/g.87302 Transcript_26584/m.87302 type:complete len:153 (+) Transcript_26584:435-893(+)|eukprot:XP_005834042.1 hypothetical protein GUITHDRAFT_162758 [Guillardia theta CCMP2712]
MVRVYGTSQEMEIEGNYKGARYTGLVKAVLVSTMALAAVVATIFMFGAETPVSTNSVKVVPMNGWHLSGRVARREMQNYFNKRDFKDEAKNLESFVSEHPFFSNVRRVPMPSHARHFRVFGAPHSQYRNGLGSKRVHHRTTPQDHAEETRKV